MKHRPHDSSTEPAPRGNLRNRIHEVIFEADTPAGKTFDIILSPLNPPWATAVILESVAGIRAQYGTALRAFEWTVTIAFSIEYLLRLFSVGRPLKYARSFFGLVDLLSILPTYLAVIISGAQSLKVIRALRLLRVFRVLKLVHFVGEAQMLRAALSASIRKIIVFLGVVVTTVIIVGSLMYLIEGEAGGFTNIPASIYWTIVTMTTVGYGDIAPQSPLGKFLASVLMIMGYGIIAVPTGIVTVEMASATRKQISTQACPECGGDGHDRDAEFCKHCGARL